MKWLKNLLDDPNDPVKHCDLYRDKAAGSCAHVDGPLCDLPCCSMLKDYRDGRAVADGVVTIVETISPLAEGGTRNDSSITRGVLASPPETVSPPDADGV